MLANARKQLSSPHQIRCVPEPLYARQTQQLSPPCQHCCVPVFQQTSSSKSKVGQLSNKRQLLVCGIATACAVTPDGSFPNTHSPLKKKPSETELNKSTQWGVSRKTAQKEYSQPAQVNHCLHPLPQFGPPAPLAASGTR